MRVALAAMGLILSVSAPAPALAEAPRRDFCADRPGLDTPPCTLEPGHVQIEVGGADFIHDHGADGTTDTLLLGDTLARIGLGGHVEGRIGWTPFGHVRVRDAATGAVSNAARVGDVTLGLRRNLRHPDGSGASFAVEPYLSLPAGRAPVGAGDWGAGLIMPMSFALGGPFQLAVTPELDAAVDGDGHGRHLAYGTMAGVGVDLAGNLNVTAELGVLRDRDPTGHGTAASAALSLAWRRGENMAFDIGAVAGLDRGAPDAEIHVGVARRF